MIDGVTEYERIADKADIKAALKADGKAGKSLTLATALKAVTLGKRGDSDWQRGFDAGSIAMYEFISMQLRAGAANVGCNSGHFTKHRSSE
jgi:hypothetical protein